MFSSTSFKQRLLLRVGVVAKGSRCLSILRMLDSIKPRGLHLKLMGMVPVSHSISFNKYAGEMGVPIYNDLKEMLAKETLDLILDLTSDPKILANLQQHKPESVGILDHQASMLFLDIFEMLRGILNSRRKCRSLPQDEGVVEPLCVGDVFHHGAAARAEAASILRIGAAVPIEGEQRLHAEYRASSSSPQDERAGEGT